MSVHNQKLHELCNPRFILNGRGDITAKKYSDDYRAIRTTINIAAKAIDEHLTWKEYMDGVFYKTWGEQFYKRIYTPKTINQNWAFDKWYYYSILKKHDMLTPLNLEKELIENTKRYIQSHERFWDQDGLTYNCFKNIQKYGLALSYLSVHPKFTERIESLDSDLKEIYFDIDRLYYLRDMVKRNRNLYEYIKELI